VSAQTSILDQHQGDDEQNDRLRRDRDEPGATLWFTGLPSAGKSTIAHALARRLETSGLRVQVLDGDEVRPHLSAGLGFDRAARDINVRRIGWVARLLASHGVIVLVPVIAPYADARRDVRDDHEAADVAFGEVFVSTSRGRRVSGRQGLVRQGAPRRAQRHDRGGRPVREPVQRRTRARHSQS